MTTSTLARHLRRLAIGAGDIWPRTAPRAWHPAPLAHIRERLIIHLLDGTLDGPTGEEIIATLLAEAHTEDTSVDR